MSTSKKIAFQFCPPLAMIAFASFYAICYLGTRFPAASTLAAASLLESNGTGHLFANTGFQISSFLIFGTLGLMSGFCLRRKKTATFEAQYDEDEKGNSAMIDLCRDAKMIVREDGGIEEINPAFTKIFGIESKDLLKMKLDSLIDQVVELAEEKQPVRKLLQSTVEEDAASPQDFVILQPAKRVLRVQKQTLPAHHSLPGRSIWNFEDISCQRELEYEVRQAQKMEVVGQLAMGIAHDFNNLLTGINGNLAILEMEMETKKVDLPERKNLRFAIQAGSRAGALVKQLLGFSRRDHLQADSFQVDDVINEVMGILKASLKPSTNLEAAIAKDLWNAIGDSNMLSQVLVNLMKNSHDALPNGGTITISAENSKNPLEGSNESAPHHPGNFVHLSVADDGTGMSPAVKARIFDAFYTTKGTGKGTGLGLSTSLKIVERMGGWISVESEEGAGTQFDIFLPRGQNVKEEKPCPKVSFNEFRKSIDPKETILIVDDDEMVRMVAVTLLKRIGYRIMIASDGEEALKIYEEKGDEIDLVMLDLTMPKLSGEETFARLRKDYDYVPVLICSGYLVDLSVFEEQVGFCPDGFVQKPYRIESIVTGIQDALDGNIVAA